mgnify:CR=1 FL=1
MLQIAAMEPGEVPILYLLQDMQDLELDGCVRAVYSVCDCVNYVLDEEELQQAFSRVHEYLEEDGAFIFDVNTKARFENLYGELAYVFPETAEDGRESFCAWQNDYDPDSGICDFGVTVFSETEPGTGLYTRTEDEWSERFYLEEEIKKALADAGMRVVAVAGAEEGDVLPEGLDWDSPVTETCGKIHFAAIAVK